MFPCPCCGFLTFYEEPNGTFAICPVCYWEDDNIQLENPDYEGGANAFSLNQCRKNYSEFGAVERRLLSLVRPPLPEEIP
jgi:hypothetical protein